MTQQRCICELMPMFQHRCIFELLYVLLCFNLAPLAQNLLSESRYKIQTKI